MAVCPDYRHGRCVPPSPLPEIGRQRREVDVLARSEAEEAATDETVAKQSECSVLQGIAEVDQHIAAKDEMRLAEHDVGDEVVVEEGDVAPQPLVELDEIVAGAVVIAEGAFATGFEVVARPVACVARGVDAFAGRRQCGVVEVGGVDPRALVESLLFEQDRQRIDFLPLRATGLPDVDLRMRGEYGEYRLAQGLEHERIAEHLRDGHGQSFDHPADETLVVQHASIQFTDSAGGVHAHEFQHASL